MAPFEFYKEAIMSGEDMALVAEELYEVCCFLMLIYPL